MKRFLILLMLVALLPAAALAEAECPLVPLPLEGPAPYPAVADAFGADGLTYDDGTLSVRVAYDVAFGTNITYVYVTITDPSQLRTALAAKYPSKQKQTVPQMAEKNNAVLAINGDFFSYHTEGIVLRSGQLLRKAIRKGRDTLVIDYNGDFNIISWTDEASWEALAPVAKEAFCFGPGLIVDGVVQEFDYRKKTSCGYPTPAQRLAICQLDKLSYLIVATEGPEQDKAAGLSIPQLTELLVAAGAKQAYNLDGGNSTTVMLGDRRMNAPESKYRAVGDIIYFATLRQE